MTEVRWDAEIADERVEVALRTDAHLGEGPVWDGRTDTLVWVDILDGVVHRFDPSTGEDEATFVGQPVGAAVPRLGGGLLLALRDGFGLQEPDGSVSLLAEVEAEMPMSRMNDGKCDPAGRLWAGTMDEDHAPGRGALYRLDHDRRVTRMVSEVTVSNGLAWSPDGATMYYVDTPTQGVDAFDFDLATGEVANRRRLITIPGEDGSPDGMTVDSDGCLWVALWGGFALRRYTPHGALEDVVPMPVSRVTSCAFGGADLRELYVTTARRALGSQELASQPLAGSLFRLRPGVAGLPATPCCL